MDINHDHNAVEAYLKQVAQETGNLALRGLRTGFMGYKPGTPMLLSYEAVHPEPSSIVLFKRPKAFDVEANKVLDPKRMGVAGGHLFLPIERGLEVFYTDDQNVDSVIYDQGKVLSREQLGSFYQIIGDAQIPSLVDLLQHDVLFTGAKKRLILFIGLAANKYLADTGLRDMLASFTPADEWVSFYENFLSDYK